MLLSASTAAELLGISQAGLQHLTAAGHLPCVHVGESVYYYAAAIYELMDAPLSPAPFQEWQFLQNARRCSFQQTK